MAAAAITPRSFETAFIPASLPGVIFTIDSLPAANSCYVVKQLFYIRELKVLYSRCGNGALDDFVHRQRRLGALHIGEARLRGRMTRGEQRAAVLIRDDRDLVGAEPLCLRRDFSLVEADQRTENRHGDNLVDRRQVFQRLRGNLAN